MIKKPNDNFDMKSTREKASITRVRLWPRTWLALAVTALVAGCSVAPKAITADEVRDRVQSDTQRMYRDQVPITAPITMEEAVARALKYNLDYRLKRMESALALGLAEHASHDMLPRLVASAGYTHRNNDSGGVSVGILDRVVSDRPTSSDERSRSMNGIEFSWNALDFGVSYYRARQQGDQYLIAEERRRKVVQNLLQDVRAAYWRALGAQRLNSQAEEVLQRAAVALQRSREAEKLRVIPPSTALAYQRALLDATTLLNQRRQDLEFAQRELAALMNVAPGTTLRIADADETALPAVPRDLQKLEEMALMQRPELREEDFRKRITADEARKQMLGMLPGLSFDIGRRYDSNAYTYNNHWTEGGVNLAWNLMRLVALPSLQSSQKYQDATDDARRMALSMAILTQTRVSVERYKMAMQDFELADQAAQVDARMAAYTKASVTAKIDSELEAIRTQARAVLGAYQRSNAYANAQIAFGRLYNTLGFDPIADDFDHMDLAELVQRVKDHLHSTEKDAFSMSSNLFGRRAAVSVSLTGIQDPVQQVRMQAVVAELLGRHHIVTHEPGGVPLVLNFNSSEGKGVGKVVWTLRLEDGVRPAVLLPFTTTVPASARPSVYESSLVAALNTHLPRIKSWLKVD